MAPADGPVSWTAHADLAEAAALLGMFHAARRGEFTVTDGALEDLLGREPTSLRTILEGAI